MCEPKARACSPSCASGRTLGGLAGIGLASLLAASVSPALPEALLIAEDIGAVIAALAVIGLVAWLWRLGVVAWSVRAGMRTTTWTCTQVRAVAAAQARARARRRVAVQARGLGELPAGAGPVVGRVVGRPARLGVPRSEWVTTVPTTPDVAGAADSVVAAGHRFVYEAEAILGGELTDWQRRLLLDAALASTGLPYQGIRDAG